MKNELWTERPPPHILQTEVSTSVNLPLFGACQAEPHQVAGGSSHHLSSSSILLKAWLPLGSLSAQGKPELQKNPHGSQSHAHISQRLIRAVTKLLFLAGKS